MKNTMLLLICMTCMVNVSIARYHTMQRNQSFFLQFNVCLQKIMAIIPKSWLGRVWYIVLQKSCIILLIAHKIVRLFFSM